MQSHDRTKIAIVTALGIGFFIGVSAIIANAAAAIPWMQPTPASNYITPTNVNGQPVGILVNGTSTLATTTIQGTLNASSTSNFTGDAVFYGTTTLATTTTGFLNGTIVVDGVHFAQTSAGINTAISLCGKNGIGNVYLPGAIYTVNSRMSPVSNCHVHAAGKGVTILQGNVPGDWDFYYNSATQISNFSLSDLTIDLQNGASASGIQLSNASTTVIQNIDFRNGAAGGWFLYYGANGSSATANVQNYNNKVIDVDFTNHAGSLEAMLVFNATSTQITRPTFQNVSSPGLGLWQKDYNTTIDDLYCKDSSGPIFYYSITTEGITLNNPKSDNCSTIVQGSNISDNGEFGLTQAQNLIITNPILTGGPKSKATSAIQLGAVNNAHVINPDIRNYDIGINVQTGNNNANASTTNWSIIGGSIRDNNAENTAAALHPGIMIAGTQTTGSSVYGLIEGVKIYDDQASPTQTFPIVFDGNATFDHIIIANNRLSAPASLGGVSIGLADGATLGTHKFIYANEDYTGTNPNQTSLGGPWVQSGTNIYYAASAGLVGIATTTPDYWLTVDPSDYTTSMNLLHLGNPNNNFGGTRLLIENAWSGNEAANSSLMIQANSSAPRFTVTGAGRVGIASSSPDSAMSILTSGSRAYLHVGDTANQSTSKVLIENGWSGSGTYGLMVQRNNNTPQLDVDGTGFVGIASSTPWRTLDVNGSVGFKGLTTGAGAGSLCLTSNNEVVFNSGANCIASTNLSWMFGSVNDFGTTTVSTTTSIYSIGVFFSSSTAQASQFPYASTTAITSSVASTSLLYVNGLGGCTGGQYLTWANGAFGCATDQTTAGASPFSWLTNFATGTAATTTSIWTQGVFFSSSTVAASQFPYASTTAISAVNVLSTNVRLSGELFTTGTGDQMNFQSGSFVFDETNGSAGIRSGFSAKNLYFRDSGSTAHSTFSLDTGSLGLGMITPTYQLDVTGAGHFTTYVDARNYIATSTSVASTFAASVGIGTTSPWAFLSIDQIKPGSQTPMFEVSSSTNSSTSSVFIINAANNIGIGTSSPMSLFAMSAASSTINFTPIHVIASIINAVTYIFEEIDSWGHLITSGPAPSVSGGTSTVAGNDRNGTITVTGTLLTSITLTFAHAYAAAPDCTISDSSTGVTAGVTSISASQLVIGFSAGVNSGTVWYICQAHM